ncbi:MAG: hypothetical protein AAF718_09105 [Pseudomonadota bacterium]
MRPILISAMLCCPVSGFAEPITKLAPVDTDGFRLGGAASRAAIVATEPSSDLAPSISPRLSLPLTLPSVETARTESALGPATIFLSDGEDDGRDALELGTFLSRGQARAGMSVTYIESEDEVARSQLFVDYALTNQFSVGLSGIFDSDVRENEPVRQIGLNAEFSTTGGAFVQGGVTGATDYNPVIGLSVGLRF